MNKQGLQFSFAWIFAIIVGVFILALAIFGVNKFMNLEKTSQDAQAAKDISVLLNPLEISFETGKATMVSTSVDTKIYGECSLSGFFGKQILTVKQETFNKESDSNIGVSSYNKYIFTEDSVEGRKFYVFSKSFEFPFKVADLIYITSSEDNYCFINPGEEIEDELSDLKGENLLENIFLENCPSGSISVCFGNQKNCDVEVSLNGKYVEKNNGKVYFEEDALMYAAIFSNNETYECQLKRLMQRTEQLLLLYKDKADFVFEKAECYSELKPELLALANLAENFQSSEELILLEPYAKSLESKNDRGDCRLW